MLGVYTKAAVKNSEKQCNVTKWKDISIKCRILVLCIFKSRKMLTHMGIFPICVQMYLVAVIELSVFTKMEEVFR